MFYFTVQTGQNIPQNLKNNMTALLPPLAAESSSTVAQELARGEWEGLCRVKAVILTFPVGYLQ